MLGREAESENVYGIVFLWGVETKIEKRFVWVSSWNRE